MFFLLLPDGGAFCHFLGKELIFCLGIFLAPLHQLHGEGETQNPGQQGVLEDLAFLRLHFLTGVVFPDFVMGLFLPGQPQKGPAVFFALGEGGDFLVNNAFGQLTLLHPADDPQGSFGYLMGHGSYLLYCIFLPPL